MFTSTAKPALFRQKLLRLFDIVFATVALIVLAPIMLLIAFAILIESGFPILFVQSRLGLGGETFGMYKFRKFGPTEGTTGCPLTLQNDNRLTRVGAVLAKTKLDELPQIFNVLRGDMGIVGPRPESLAFADCFMPRLRGLLRHRPGLVGPSQVAFRSECKLYPAGAVDAADFYRRVLFPAKAALDLEYYESRTLMRDMGWVIRAAFAICLPGETKDPLSLANGMPASSAASAPHGGEFTGGNARVAASSPASGSLRL